MSRTFSAVETPEWPPLVDRAGLMLDEPTVFFQEPNMTSATGEPVYTGWTPGGGGSDTGGTAIGQTLYNTDGTLAGRLIEGGPGKFYLITGSGTSQRFVPFKGGTYLLDIGGGEAGQFMIDPEGGATKLGTLKPPTGSTRAAPAYGSTRAGQSQAERAAMERQAASDLAAAERLEAQLQAQEDEALRNRDFQTAERIAGELAAATAAKLAAQNQLKLARLGEAGALSRTFEDIKSRARDVIAGMMGENPFRGAVRAAGGVPRGVDPYEAFEAELTGVANMPTPQFSSESNLGQLESAIAAMNKTQMPTAQWPMGGRAGGGPVAPGEAVRVGELGEEIVVNEGDGKVKVIPIAENAAKGGTYKFDRESIGQVLGPVYSHLGFTTPPAYRRSAPTASAPQGRGLTPRGFKGGNLAGMQRMGIEPRLVRDASTGRMYFKNQQGAMQPFWDADKYGFDMSDVVNLSSADIRGMGPEGRALRFQPPSLVEPYSPYASQPIPLRLPAELGGQALPDPRTIANLFRTFDPANREILIDALGLSEMGREQIQSLFRAFTPAGTAGRVGFG